MPRLAWLTDLHLNFCAPNRIDRLIQEVRAANIDRVLLGGDIGEAADFAAYLRQLAKGIDRPIDFVLGNHDYYRGSIAEVRAAATALTRDVPLLTWLPAVDVIPLSADTALVGHDGWGDGGYGDVRTSTIVLNDFLLIEELRATQLSSLPLSRNIRTPALLEKLDELGAEAAAHLQRVLPPVLADYAHVLVLTHVPPFHEACWHEGRLSDSQWVPHFGCKQVGDVLRACMRAHPERRMTVLCGHTHSDGRAEILPNLLALTGKAVYGEPTIQDVLDV